MVATRREGRRIFYLGFANQSASSESLSPLLQGPDMPAASLLGGAVIGLAATRLILFTGRIAGISGILGGLPPLSDTAWRLADSGRVTVLGVRKLSSFEGSPEGCRSQHFKQPRPLLARLWDPSANCAGREVVAWGRSRGLSRFRCKGCGRTFNALTKTPMAHLRKKERWLDHAQAMIEGKSLAKTAETCGVHPTTAFRWRHRFLGSPALDKPRTLSGIVEADETFILESFKGRWSDPPRGARKRGGSARHPGLHQDNIPVLVARDRKGATFDAVLPQDDSASIAAALTGVVTGLRPMRYGKTVLLPGSPGGCRSRHFKQPRPLSPGRGTRARNRFRTSEYI